MVEVRCGRRLTSAYRGATLDLGSCMQSVYKPAVGRGQEALMSVEPFAAFLQTSHSHRLSRRRVFQAAASLGLAGSLIGRGLGPSAARPARQEPKSGGTLGVGLPIEPDILDPHVGSS